MLTRAIKAFFKTILNQYPVGTFFSEIHNSKQEEILEERLLILENEIKDTKYFIEQFKYLSNDNSKYIHMRNFLRFYFHLSDPALIDTNVKIIIDYVLEKNKYNIYDMLLEKMCLLNKYSIEVMRDIKKLSKKENHYYSWEEFIKINNIPEKTSFSTILNSEIENENYTKIAYGFKALMEAGFITNYPTLYPGSIDVNSLDEFELTSIGKILLKYL